MSFAQAFRGLSGKGDIGWRVQCAGFPLRSCLAIISSHKPSGLCHFCERSKAMSDAPKLECGLPIGKDVRCRRPMLHLDSCGQRSPRKRALPARTT